MIQSGTIPFTAQEIALIEQLKKWSLDEIEKLHIAAYLLNNHMPDLVLAGGMFTSMYHYETPKDIDLFVLNENKKLWDIMVHSLIKQSSSYLIRERDRGAMNNYFKDNDNILATALNSNTKLQVILTKYKTRKELIDHFDYKHCCVSLYPIVTIAQPPTQIVEPKLYITPSTFNAIRGKNLIVNGNNTPAQWRRDKFVARGFA